MAEGRARHAVTAVFLGGIQGLVGAFEQALRVFADNHLGDTEGAGNLLLLDQLRVLNRHAELFGKALGILDRRIATEDHEFFAAPTHKRIGIADLALDKLGEVHQDFVAHHVTVSIVHVLEVVDIQDHEGHGAVVLLQIFLFAHEHAAETGTVQAACQRVFLAGLFVFALLDLEGAQVLFKLFAFLIVGRAFATVVKEADHKDNKEGNEPEGDQRRRKFFLLDFLALEAEALDFERPVPERSIRARLDLDQGDVREVNPRLVNVDFVLGDPPARYAEFLRHENGRVGFFEREKFDFVELERGFVPRTGERAVITAHVETDRSFATGLHPHENTVETGKVPAARLAVAQENLHAHIRVGIAFLEFIVQDNGGIGTGKFHGRGAAVRRVRFRHQIRIVVQVQRLNYIKPILIREKRDDRHGQKHENQDVHPEQHINLFKYPRHRRNPA